VTCAFPEHCMDYNNFNSMFAIISGLGHGSVSRLRQTWDRIPNKWNKLFVVSTAWFFLWKHVSSFACSLRVCVMCVSFVRFKVAVSFDYLSRLLLTGLAGFDGSFAEHGKVQESGQSWERPSTTGQSVWKCLSVWLVCHTYWVYFYVSAELLGFHDIFESGFVSVRGIIVYRGVLHSFSVLLLWSRLTISQQYWYHFLACDGVKMWQ